MASPPFGVWGPFMSLLHACEDYVALVGKVSRPASDLTNDVIQRSENRKFVSCQLDSRVLSTILLSPHASYCYRMLLPRRKDISLSAERFCINFHLDLLFRARLARLGNRVSG